MFPIKFLIQRYILIKDFKKPIVEFQAREIRKQQKAASASHHTA